jgi:hypothetical protein
MSKQYKSKDDVKIAFVAVTLGVLALIAFFTYILHHEQANVVSPLVVREQENKYQIYDLQGDLDDLNFHTSQGVIYQRDELPERVNFISFKDQQSGKYQCEFICKDKKGNVVGLNPVWAKLYGKKVSE